ncbi:MAG: sensor histidine kinase [Verrucomicrobiae bacterium]|nr:sensor histidine kinase [Verrucomicrobiae bacterium]
MPKLEPPAVECTWRLCLVAGMTLALQALPGTCAAETRAPLLTNVSDIRALSPAEASQRLPVRLRGVVIGESEAGGEGFAIHDGAAGIYLRASAALVAQLHPGDLVEVEGATDPGEFAPFVRVRELRKLGKAPVPEPRQVTFDEIASGRLDAQWVEVRGIVRHYEPDRKHGRKCRLEVATGGGRLIVRVNVPELAEPIVDAEVRLRGVCYYLVNKYRQTLSPLLAIPAEVPIIVEVPAPKDPFAAPVQPIGSLLQFAYGGLFGHRVRVRGVVTCVQPREFWLRDETRGLCVHARDATSLAVGDVVDVVGFPGHGGYSPILEDAIFRKLGSGPAPAPVLLTNASDAFDHDADLVTLEGVLVGQESTRDGWAWHVQSGGSSFRALVPARMQPARSKKIELGSRVRLTGICNVLHDADGPSSGMRQPSGFQLLLRTPADVAVISPPSFWHGRRLLWFLAGAVVALVLAVVGIMVAARLRLREQAAQRAMAEAQFTAVLAERNRMAREIHDILAQGLSAIVLHLDLIRDEVKAVSARAAKHLEIALELARSSMADARNAVWNMRSQVLENADLATALPNLLEQLTSGTGIRAQFDTAGQPRRLPPLAENALLRICQEAVTNALQHARPTRIDVLLSFDNGSVCLRVRDDGRGFVPEQARPGRSGFGLVGMRERVNQLGGQFKVRSSPGEGTEVVATIPMPQV